MRAPLRVLLLAALPLALALAGTAAAGNGGFAPPEPRSPNAERIEDTYWLILGITGFVFVVVEAALILFVVRFRSRGRSRDVEGPQIRGHTRLELVWTAVPVLLLAAISAFVFYKLPGIKNVPEARAGQGLRIRVEGHLFYWQFRYPGGQVSIDRLVVPVDEVVRLEITSPDVIHSWWVPELGGKLDAIPGRTNHTWFRADRVGVYGARCAEFCGIQHAVMNGTVHVVPRAEYRRFLASHGSGSQAVGDEVVEGVCTKCHGLAGEGDIGPSLVGSALLADRPGLEELLRSGRAEMPAVGKTWSKEQLNAAIAAIRRAYARGR